MKCSGENPIEAVSGAVYLGNPLWTPTARVKPNDNRSKPGRYVPFRGVGHDPVILYSRDKIALHRLMATF